MSGGRAPDPAELLNAEDYSLPAELFVARRSGSKRGALGYHRFATAAEAIEYAVEEFESQRPDDIVMAVADKRFNLTALRTLYRSTHEDVAPPSGEPAS